MSDIGKTLEELPEESVVHVVFKSGDEFLLKCFERVDFSIYDSGSYLLARVVEKLVGDKAFHSPSTLIEINQNDIHSFFIQK